MSFSKREILAAPARGLRQGLTVAAHKLARRVRGVPELVPGPLTYNQDGLATVHNCDFLQDERFLEAYRLGQETGSWGPDPRIHWRVYVACWAAHKAATLEGDFVECGVNRGGLSRAILHFVDFSTSKKTLYLFDTFRGFEEKYISEGERQRGVAANYDYDECYDEVCKTFAGFRATLIRGPVPDTLPQAQVNKVSYLSLDMNCAAPELAAAEYFWDKLVPGAVVVLDDYGFKLHQEQKDAFDDFARQRGVMVLPVPTGQGLIFKP